MSDNNYKVYKFDYGNIFRKFLCYLIQFMANSGVILFGFVFCFMLVQLVIDNISNDIVVHILSILLIIIQSAISLFFGVFTFLPRKVVLYDNYIKIQKNAMNFFVEKTWFSEIIPYSTIESCILYDKKITYSRSSFMRQKTYPCTFFNWNSLVKITDKYNNNIYIPIKNAVDFVEDVNEMVAIAKMKN